MTKIPYIFVKQDFYYYALDYHTTLRYIFQS